MYYNARKSVDDELLDGWRPPTEEVRLSFSQYLRLAMAAEETRDAVSVASMPLHYLEIDVAEGARTPWLVEVLPFFTSHLQGRQSFMIVDPSGFKGVNVSPGLAPPTTPQPSPRGLGAASRLGFACSGARRLRRATDGKATRSGQPPDGRTRKTRRSRSVRPARSAPADRQRQFGNGRTGLRFWLLLAARCGFSFIRTVHRIGLSVETQWALAVC